jgi:hypothetical protein
MADPNPQNGQGDSEAGTLPFLASMIGEAAPRIPKEQQDPPPPKFTFEDSDAPYMHTTGFKGHTEWGQPSNVLKAAQQFPGLSPSPWMPQLHHVSDIVKKNSNFFVKNGSLLQRLYAGQMAMYRAKYESDYRKGLREEAADAHNQYVDFQKRLTDNNKQMFRLYADAISVNKNDPEKARQALLDLTYQFDDQPLRDVLQTQGFQRALEVISERHNNDEDQLKIIHQRLAAEKLQDDLDEEKKLNADLQIITNPNARTEAQQSYIQSGQPDPSAIPYTTSAEKGGTGGAPDFSRFPTTSPATHADLSVARSPGQSLPSTFPSGVTPQNVQERRAELTDWANRNGVAIPPPDTAGMQNWLSTHAPAVPSTPPAGTPAPAVPAAGAAPNTRTSAEAKRLAPILGMTPQELDRMGWDFLMYNRPGISGTQHGKAAQYRQTLVNTAVEKIALGKGGLQDTIEGIMQSIGPAPSNLSAAQQKQRSNGITDQISQYNSMIGNQLRWILNGQTELPRTGFGATAKGPQMLRGIVASIDPGFNEFRFRDNQRTHAAFYGNGQFAQRIVNFNTWIGHADLIAHTIDQMPNTSYPDYNTFVNAIRTRLGGVAATQFNTSMQFVSTELAKAFKGGSPSLTEIHDIKTLLNANMSPNQMRASLRVMTELAHGQLQSLAGYWNLGTSESKKAEDFITDPDILSKYNRLRSLPYSGAVGLKDIEYYENLGKQNISLQQGATPEEATKLQNWLVANPNDPMAAELREKLTTLGWAP